MERLFKIIKKLQEFISKIKTSGLAKNNRFTVLLNPPLNLGGNLQSILLYCSGVNLPGITIGSNQVRIFGEIFEFPYEKIYPPCELTFYVDANMEVKKLFDDWINQIYDPLTKHFYYYKNYISELEILVQDTKNNEVYSVKLFEAYPKNIGDIRLDYSNSEIMVLNVTMAYKYFTTSQREGISENNKLSGSLFPSIYSSILNSENITNKYFTDFKNFQSDQFNKFSDIVPTTAISNAKSVLNSFLSKTKG